LFLGHTVYCSNKKAFFPHAWAEGNEAKQQNAEDEARLQLM